MKIALVANTSWNLYNFRKGLIDFLLGEGHQIYLIAPQDEHTPLLKEWNIDYFCITLQNKGSNPLKDWAFGRALRKIYAQIKPDIVLHFTIKPNIYGSLACRSLRIPCINNVSGLGTTFIREGFTSYMARRLYQFAFRFAGKVFFQNADDLEIFIQKNLIKKAKTALLPGSGIDLDKFQPPLAACATKPFIFLMIARLIYDKGIREYVEAARIVKRQFPEVHFILLGAFEKDLGNKLNITEEEVLSWREVVSYMGSSHDVRPYIAKASVVVLPSYREGTPRSLLEAAAMGKPLLATRVAGCKEIVSHGENGLLCEAKNAKDLAEKMIEMLGFNEQTLETMGHKSRQKAVETFDEKIVWKLYQKEILTLLC